MQGRWRAGEQQEEEQGRSRVGAEAGQEKEEGKSKSRIGVGAGQEHFIQIGCKTYS